MSRVSALKQSPVVSDLAHLVVAAMERKGYQVDRGPGELNIVYVEGMNPDGTPNADEANKWNDLRLVIRFEGGVPKIVGEWAATTEPGRYWTENPMSPLGAARIEFGQYKSWQVGMHRNNHEALVQTGGEVTVCRDLNKDGQRTGDKRQTGEFGINQHWGYDLPEVEKASAGCLVGQSKDGHRQFMALVKSDPRYQANRKYVFAAAILPESEVLTSGVVKADRTAGGPNCRKGRSMAATSFAACRSSSVSPNRGRTASSAPSPRQPSSSSSAAMACPSPAMPTTRPATSSSASSVPNGIPSLAGRAAGEGERAGAAVGTIYRITATVFGGSSEFKRSGYDGHVITDDELGVALPFRFGGTPPTVRVFNPANGASVVCDIVDVGPWNSNDPYWQTGALPQAESGLARTAAGPSSPHRPDARRPAPPVSPAARGAWEFAAPSAAQPSMEYSTAEQADAASRPNGGPPRRQRPPRRPRLRAARSVDEPDPGFDAWINAGSNAWSTPAQMPGQNFGQDDVTALLERLVPLVERLQGQGGVTGVTPIASQAPAQLGKALDLIKTILAPGADGTPPPLGQVNGALGQTIGNLLNGKKTAIGLLGAVITPMLTQASTTTALAPVLAMLTPAAGLAPFHPADLPRADRLGRAWQDGEMVPRHRAAAESIVILPAVIPGRRERRARNP